MNSGRTWRERSSRIVTFTVVLAACWTWCGSMPIHAAATAGSVDLPDVLATVNGKPILKANVVANLVDAAPVALALKRAIDRTIAAEQAVKEGLDQDPGHLKRIARLKDEEAAREGMAMRRIVEQYLHQVPEYAEASAAAAQVTDAQIDAYAEENKDDFGKQTGKNLRRRARRALIRERRSAAHDAWMKARLTKAGVTVNGVAIPRHVIEAAVDAKSAVKSIPEALFNPAVRPMGDAFVDSVLELARAQAADPVPADDPAAAKKILAGTVIEAEGTKIVLAEHYAFEAIAAAAQGGPSNGELFDAISEAVCVAEARRKGLGKDPALATGYVPIQKFGPAVIEVQLAYMYFQRYNLTMDGVAVTDKEVGGVVRALLRMVVGKGDDELRARLTALKQEYSAVAITDAEIDHWGMALMGTYLESGRRPLYDRIKTAKLDWKRAAHLEPFRAKATIERFVD